PTEEPAPTEQTPTEEPTTAPTEQPTQEPLPSPTEQANIVDKTGWENAPKWVSVSADEIGLGNSFQVCLKGHGGTGKYTFAYYIYKGNTAVQKTAYSKNIGYLYTPKTTGEYHALVFIKNEKGEIITLKSDKVTVFEKYKPIKLYVSFYTGNIVLGDVINFEIRSYYGNESTPHMYAYYVYKDNTLLQKFPYKQAEHILYDGSNTTTRTECRAEVSYTPKSTGKYKFIIFAKDALGKITTYTTDEYLVKGMPLNLRATLSNKNLRIGEVANVIAEASGGSGTYQYAYYVYKNNALIQRVGYTANAQFNYTPTSEGTYKVLAFVKDSLGAIQTEATHEFFVTNKPPFPLNVYLNVTLYSNAMVFETYPEGGFAPYQYAYYIYKDNTLIERLLPYIDGEGDSLEGYYHELLYIPKNAGTYKVLAFVKDATGAIKTNMSAPLEFKSELEMYSAPKTKGKIIYLGNAITLLDIPVRGGEGFYKYAYYIYKEDTLMEKLPYTNNANLAYKPKSTGKYKILVFVKDDSGKIVYGMSNEFTVRDAAALKFDYVNFPEVALPNNQIDVSARAYGGVEPHQYAYYIYHNNNIIKKTAYSEGERNYDYYFGETYTYHKYGFTATSPGNYHVIVFVKDATGAIITQRTDTCVVSNNPQPSNYEEMNIGANLNKYTSSFRLFFEINGGGMGPYYQYAYYIYKDEVRIKTTGYSQFNSSNINGFIDYNVMESGTYKIILFVKDGIGKTKTHVIDNIVFDLSNEPSITEIKFNNDYYVYLGKEFSVKTTIDNGIGSKIAYNVIKDGVYYYKSNFMSLNNYIHEWNFKPSHPGKYIVQAVIRTPNGSILNDTTLYGCEVIE
ncbi:MAG: hypothetical protein GYA87_01030, partial [Christensenellaceae bacterium]|nr:hypothetical protein [Christensenellaceae bacterium]